MFTSEKREILDGQAIRRARLRLGLTQRELAERCGVDPSNINKAEHRNAGIGARKLPALAEALKITVDELLTVSLQPAA
jgi:transcriptional regulator with XRE-family HTH domain